MDSQQKAPRFRRWRSGAQVSQREYRNERQPASDRMVCIPCLRCGRDQFIVTNAAGPAVRLRWLRVRSRPAWAWKRAIDRLFKHGVRRLRTHQVAGQAVHRGAVLAGPVGRYVLNTASPISADRRPGTTTQRHRLSRRCLDCFLNFSADLPGGPRAGICGYLRPGCSYTVAGHGSLLGSGDAIVEDDWTAAAITNLDPRPRPSPSAPRPAFIYLQQDAGAVPFTGTTTT